MANAGANQNVVTGSAVTLDGSTSSDANGDPLTYAWTLTSKPAGSTAALVGATSARPTFTADTAGTYVASLVVNDGKVGSTSATVVVTVLAGGIVSKIYSVTARRLDSNFYSIVGPNIPANSLIQTKFCFEFAFFDSATLVMSGFSGSFDGEITFANGNRCDVAGAYSPLPLLPGLYVASLTYETTGFYTDWLHSLVVQAAGTCFRIVVSNQSEVNMTFAGGVAYNSGLPIGTITFSDGSACNMIGVYGLTKLN